VRARATHQLGLRFAKERQHVATDLEADHMSTRRLVGRIAGPVALGATRYHPLDLPDRLRLARVEPLALGRDHGDPGELACDRPADLPGAQRLGHRRQLFERFGDADPLGRDPRRVSKDAFDIFEVRPVRKRDVNCSLHASKKPLTFLEIVARPPLGEPDELGVNVLPLHAAVDEPWPFNALYDGFHQRISG
jgi:hypothetical protein